jgi:hypothetical protein
MFQSFQVMKSFVGHNNAIHLVVEYDVKEVILLLMTFFDWLNPIAEAIVAPCDEHAL